MAGWHDLPVVQHGAETGALDAPETWLFAHGVAVGAAALVPHMALFNFCTHPLLPVLLWQFYMRCPLRFCLSV